MDIVIKAAIAYVVVFLFLRLSGRRTVAEMNGFDVVVLLIIGDTAHHAIAGHDHSLTAALLIVTTLLLIDVLFSLIETRSPRARKWLDGTPTLLVERGKPLADAMRKARVTEEEVLAAARERQGLVAMDQIQYAVLETNGVISVIPKQRD
jgi:uncharacterized membrane protein YcaP (DUF421 family)